MTLSPSTYRRFGNRARASAAAIGGGGGGSPSLGTDTFTGTNGVALHLHTPTGTVPGTSWTDANGVFSDLQLLNNRLAIVGGSSGGTLIAGMATATVPPADQIVTADLTMFTPLDAQILGIGARCSGGGAVGGLYLRFSQNASDPAHCAFIILRDTDGFAQTQLGSSYTFAFPTSGTVVPVVIRCVGTTIQCDIDGVANAITATDSSITGRQPGIIGSRAADGVNSTATTGVHLDNLSIRAYP